MVKRKYRTLDEVSEEYYRNHPDEIDGYLTTVFEEYAKDGCTPALLSSLRMIARVKGISVIAEQTGLTRNGIQKALSEQGNPRLENINSIMRALGYHLTLQKIEANNPL
jgi:probable addiction module antidote protein